MAARNRPRSGIPKDDASDAHEERTMWNTIVNDLRKLKQLQVRAAEVAKQQVDLETKMGKCKPTSFHVMICEKEKSFLGILKIWMCLLMLLIWCVGDSLPRQLALVYSGILPWKSVAMF